MYSNFVFDACLNIIKATIWPYHDDVWIDVKQLKSESILYTLLTTIVNKTIITL